MQHLYIDESGSMTNQHTTSWPYFVISVVRPGSPDRLRRIYSRFVKAHLDELKSADAFGKMFKGEAFDELKGAAFTPDLKREFVSYFCRNGALDVFFIVLENDRITDDLYANTARAFNYVIKLAFEYFIHKGLLPDDEYTLQLDERNERTDTRHFLQNYLNTELRMEKVLSKDVKVQYFDSSQNKLIQIADVMANLYYSHLRTGAYSSEIQLMKTSGCLKQVFTFPPANR